ncbi:MAG: CvpA family protein [Candidatus Omnitrophota bacterium]|nr:CvpA family protein [Candidatus Omnitrophota bacterium]
MVLEAVKNFNWVDIIITLLMVRVFYISIRCGFIPELFKICGTILSIYVSLHNYLNLSEFIHSSVSSNSIPVEVIDLFSFLCLTGISYLIFILLREGFAYIIRMEAVPKLNRYGGLMIGVARAIFLSGLVIYILAISTVSYLQNSVYQSYLGSALIKIAPFTYESLWNGLGSKFFTNEKFNDSTIKIRDNFKQ